MHLDRLLSQAENLLNFGRVEAAIEILREVLSQEPDLADGHALLAHCLAGQKRLSAARYEAGQALAFEPDSAMAHHAMVIILMASRKLREAERHLDILFGLLPNTADLYLLRAQLFTLQNRKSEILEALEKARSLEPENLQVLVDMGEHHFRYGSKDKAWGLARQILEQEPEHQEALVLMGFLQLHKGELEQATESVQFALRQNPNDPGTLRLLASIKARRNPFLGLWWRYNAKMSEFGEKGSLMILLGLFFVYRVSTIYMEQIGKPDLVGPINIIWLCLCAYTWVGPELFRRSLRKEMKKVLLNDDF